MAAAAVEQVPLSLRVGGQLQIAVDAGLLAAADPATDTTLTLLKARVDTNTALVDASLYPIAVDTKAAIDSGLAIGLFSETHGVSTMAALIALTDAAVGYRQGFRG